VVGVDLCVAQVGGRDVICVACAVGVVAVREEGISGGGGLGFEVGGRGGEADCFGGFVVLWGRGRGVLCWGRWRWWGGGAVFGVGGLGVGEVGGEGWVVGVG
jgi:hypothetical protein